MGSGNELARGNAYLVALLGSDSAMRTAAPGGVWKNIAPLGTQTPYLVYAWQGGRDVSSNTANRVLTSNLWRIEAIGPTSNYDGLVAAANRLDALLYINRNYTGSDFYVNAAYRESALDRDEDIDGTLWSHLGGLYRLLIQMQ